VDSGAESRYRGRRLILAAGALNSARIALASFADRESRLPVLDNQVSMVPLVHAWSLGRAAERRSHGLAQLNAVHRDEAAPAQVTAQATLYTFQSLLASEVLLDFPLPMRGALAASRHLLPALVVTTFFYPDAPRERNRLGLGEDGALRIEYRDPPPAGEVERLWRRAVLPSGFLSTAGATRVHPPGNGIHYAGTLPMSRAERRYTTDLDGRLRPTRFVHVADGAVFPNLPAKNHTFTIMANARRVARAVVRAMGVA
jgi:choline dehydrogenase-like flavoprotein